MARRFLMAYALIVVLAGAGAFILARRGSADVQYRTVAATLGTVTQTVSLSGNLAPIAETDLDFGGSGKVTSVDVAVGQKVSSGTRLASIDPTTLQANLTTAQATLASAEARLALDRAGPTAQELAAAEAQVSSAVVAMQNDDTNLTDTITGNQAAVQQAETALQEARNTESGDCADAPGGQQCAQDKQAVNQDVLALQSAQVKAQQTDDQARGQVNAARVDLQNAQGSLAALRDSVTPQQIEMDQSQVQIDQVNVNAAQAALDQATLSSPVSGVVAQVNVAVGDEVGATSGSSSASSSTTHAVVVITPGVFAVTGAVSDAEVNEIALGQQAQVVPAGSQEAVTGKVTQIAEEATVTSGVATFPVTVALDGTNIGLRAGMSASVSIVVNQVVQVLTVPTSAVHTTSAGSTVQVLVNGAPQTRVVQVGASDTIRTQILSGLNPGDEVIIATITGAVPASGSGNGLFGGGGRGTFGGGGGFGGGNGGRAAVPGG